MDSTFLDRTLSALHPATRSLSTAELVECVLGPSPIPLLKDQYIKWLYSEEAETLIERNDVGWVLKRPSAKGDMPQEPPLQVEEEPTHDEIQPREQVLEEKILIEEQWDDDQLAVIQAPRHEHQLVESPPGCGKTAVACRRVAWLAEEAREEDRAAASRILMISFTRTAIAEIRKRIGHYCKNPETPLEVRIATLDSHSFQILTGLTREEREALLGGSYDENIERLVEYIRSGDSKILEELEKVDHLIVDEAQDLTGARAELVALFVQNLREKSGCTIFADRYQAIYGFTEKGNDSGRGVAFRESPDWSEWQGRASERALGQIYRTTNDRLVQLVLDARSDLLKGESTRSGTVYQDVRECIKSKAAGSVDIESIDRQTFTEGELVLFRRRVDVLFQSSLLSNEGASHRLRLSGMPIILDPMIGCLLAGHTDLRLQRAEFDQLVQLHRDSRIAKGRRPDELWSRLEDHFGDGRGRIDMKGLRQVLSRQRPPIEFCIPELGSHGPILGTIHASKGREAEHVTLFLPRGNPTGAFDEVQEEARVLYVGATRARSELRVGEARALWNSWRSEGDGRVARRTQSGGYQIELGRENDVDLLGSVSKRVFAEPSEAKTAQALLGGYDGSHEPYVARNAKVPGGWAFVLHPDHQGDLVVGTLSSWVDDELFAIGRRPPQSVIRFLHLVGVSSVVLPMDDPRLETVHEPFATSGIWLMPVIKSFGVVFFK